MNSRIIDIVRSTNGPRGLPDTYEALKIFTPAALFDTLFPVSISSQGQLPVAFAGCALEALNPQCSLTVKEAVARLMPEWDISLEEVVFYLTKQFGASAVIAAANELQSASIEREAAVRLKVVCYWVGVYRYKTEKRRRD